MATTKFQVKLYLEPKEGLDFEAVIPVFHAWIRDKKLDELMIDVADYGHVQDGPGVVLIGSGSDYYVDLGDGRVGLLYSRKREFEGDTETTLRDALRRALRAASLLEAEPSLGFRFGTGEVQVRINDRLSAPNTDTTLSDYRAVIEKVIGQVFGGVTGIERRGTARDLFTVRVTTAKPRLADALARA